MGNMFKETADKIANHDIYQTTAKQTESLVRTFGTGATRDAEGDKLDYEGFLAPRVLQRYAQYMHSHRKQADGTLRDSDNWQKGIPRKAYLKSLVRHTIDLWHLLRNYDSHPDTEDLLCAIMFNAMGYLNELLIGRDTE